MKAFILILQILIAVFIAIIAFSVLYFKGYATSILLLITAFIVSPLFNRFLRFIESYPIRAIMKVVLVLFTFLIGIAFMPEIPTQDSRVETTPVENNNNYVAVTMEELRKFQEQWADSIVKSLKGEYMIKHTLTERQDTIYFELSNEGDNSRMNRETNSIIRNKFQNDYNTLIQKQFSGKQVLKTTTISLVVPVVTMDELRSFQKRWADGVVKSWKGAYIVKHILTERQDTIYFELSKEASKGRLDGGTNTANCSMYQHEYDSLVQKHFSGKELLKSTAISLVQNAKQKLENELNQIRQSKINKQFSAWDGAHNGVKRFVKENMHDPSSFEHIETNYTDKKNYILVRMRYRGKNMFGAKVVNSITAKVDLDGNILSVQD